MKAFYIKSNVFLLRIKRCFTAVLLLVFALFSGFFSACTTETVYFDYVSELRNNIFIAKNETFSLRIYSVCKESPYQADGIPRECVTRTEVYLLAPSGDKICNLSFSDGKQSYGGEMSYDSVKAEYYYSCTLDISACKTLSCHVEYGDEVLDFTAHSVLTETTLSPQAVLETLRTAEAELFASMTDKYGFTGEIYLRLIYEDAPFYYVGVISRNGEIYAFLMNAETGKILAKRQS